MLSVQLSKREKNIFMLCVIVILGALFYTYMVQPVVRYAGSIFGQIDELETSLAHDRRILALASTIKANYQEIIGRVKMTDSDDINVMFTDIDRIAAIHQIDMTDIKPLDTKEMEFYIENKINIEGFAAVENLVRFIYEIESVANLMKVYKLRLTARNRAGTNGVGFSMIINRVRIPTHE